MRSKCSFWWVLVGLTAVFVSVAPFPQASVSAAGTAQSGGAPQNNAVQWQTETVSLSADNFYIIAGGQTFTANVEGVDISGDPGDEAYTSLEVTWEEHGVPMRVYMYFESDGSTWQAFEIRIYDGSPGGEWVYFEGATFTMPLGQTYEIMSFSRESSGNGLYFENLSVQAFLPAGADTPVETPQEPVSTPAGMEDCHNVAAFIEEYSSSYGGTAYAPVNLLDGNPATGWSSAGGTGQPEFVTVSLGGVQAINRVLFNSYSPSPGYENDSIKDFSLEIVAPDGKARAIFQGQAAFEQGYQSYAFDPVETDHVRFVFSSTHGGNYFEAADLMVCAVAKPQAAAYGGQQVRQWASGAAATSQYSDPDWSAMQATGAPNTLECGDYSSAWASSDPFGIDELVVTFDTPVLPTQINIYQSYNPGAISSVTLLIADVGDGPPVPDSADPGSDCPGVFSITIPDGLVTQPVDGLAIRLDQSNHTGWDEIDAVELVGYTASTAPGAEPVPTEEAPPVQESGTGTLSQSHTTQNGEISFNYPEGWLVYEDLNIPYIHSSEAAQSHLSSKLQPGDIALQIHQNTLPGLYGSDPTEHITAFMAGLADYLKLTPGTVTTTTVNGRAASYMLAANDTWSLWGIAIVVADDRMIEVLAYTAPGEFEPNEPTIMAIVESIVFTP